MRSYFAWDFILAALLSLVALGDVCGQEKAKEPPEIAVLRAKLENQYRQLLDALAKNAIDMRRDDLRSLIAKHKTIDRSVHEFADQTIGTMLDPFAIGIDFVRYVTATSPRLTGRVLRIGQSRKQKTFDIARVRAGDVVILDPGEYRLPRRAQLNDVLIIGAGRDKTTFHGQLATAERVQIEGLTWECDNSPAIHLSSGGAARIVDCLVRGYNSGRGGSNGIFAIDAVLLIEGCTFEGMTGDRDKPDSFGGNALDLRLDTFLYVRNSEFLDNDEVIRASSVCTFDGCTSRHRRGQEKGIIPQARGTVLLRNNLVALKKAEGTQTFKFATDDREVVDHASRGKSSLDPETSQAVKRLGLHDSLSYWSALVHNADRSIRQAAASRLKRLLKKKPYKVSIDRKLEAKLPSALRARIIAALRTSQSLQWLDGVDQDYEWDAQYGYYVTRKR